MRVQDWIEAKKDGNELPGDAIGALVAGFTRGEIPDYQMSAWLMAVAIRGMTLNETIALTQAMAASGNTLDLSSISGIKLDKHSSGGVGDKVTLALVPIVAAAGVPMAKMSGHGLGLTGGTLDKLEGIPGFRAELSEQEILDQVRRIGACICAQTDNLAPADRAIYALRDVTGTVASIPLIASSIMSKKLACGADAIVLDIKVGAGAFMKDIGSARELAYACIAIAKAGGKRLSPFLTYMDQPLGRAVGNLVELREVVDLLRGRPVDARLKELTLTLSREAMRIAQNTSDPDKIIQSGAAVAKLREIVIAQSGDPAFIDANEAGGRLAMSVSSRESGIVQHIDAVRIAQLSARLGAAREKKGDTVDAFAGIWLEKVVGDLVSDGEVLGALNSSRRERLTPEAQDDLRSAYTIGDSAPQPKPLILDHLTTD